MLNKKILSLMLISFAVNLSAADIYSTIDPTTGKISYSNIASPNAKKVHTAPIMIYTAPKYKSSFSKAATKQTADKTQQKPVKYKTFAISSPKNDETSYNNSETITVSLTIKPNLKKGHYTRIYLNGELAADKAGNGATISKIYGNRSHTLSAKLYNKKGKLLKSSPSITFHTLKNTVFRRGGN